MTKESSRTKGSSGRPLSRRQIVFAGLAWATATSIFVAGAARGSLALTLVGAFGLLADNPLANRFAEKVLKRDLRD
jgi:hypothetical protein